MPQQTPPLVVATIRGLIGALAAAGVAYFAALQAGATGKVAAYAAIGAGLTYIVARAGVEGIYDQGRLQ